MTESNRLFHIEFDKINVTHLAGPADGWKRADGSIPMCVFNYGVPQQTAMLPIHRHRHNVTGGGFASSVNHPGIGVPETVAGGSTDRRLLHLSIDFTIIAPHTREGAPPL